MNEPKAIYIRLIGDDMIWQVTIGDDIYTVRVRRTISYLDNRTRAIAEAYVQQAGRAEHENNCTLNDLDALRLLDRIKKYFFAKTYRDDGSYALSYGEWFEDINAAVNGINVAMNETRAAIMHEVETSDGCAQMSVPAV